MNQSIGLYGRSVKGDESTRVRFVECGPEDISRATLVKG